MVSFDPKTRHLAAAHRRMSASDKMWIMVFQFYVKRSGDRGVRRLRAAASEMIRSSLVPSVLAFHHHHPQLDNVASNWSENIYCKQCWWIRTRISRLSTYLWPKITKNILTRETSLEDVRYSFLQMYQEIYLLNTDPWSSLKRICQWRFVEMSNDPDPLLELQTVNCWRL